MLLATGWANDVRIQVDDNGLIQQVQSAVSPGNATTLHGPVMPGMVNLHSHAFQRLIAGLTDVGSDSPDSFWSWREHMYHLVSTLTPEQLEAVAHYLYIEMLKAGFTTVAEFHYLHHAPDGKPFSSRTEMAQRILLAAENAGIGLCLLPVFYHHGNFGGEPPSPEQQRFVHDADDYEALWTELEERVDTQANTTLGLCFHSLRAATMEQIQHLLALAGKSTPIHMNIAEQAKEVEDCLAWCGERPIQALFNHIPIDKRWCLVHATHADENELINMAESGAIVGLCPTTEANLGDGIFPARGFLLAGGRFGIGSASHVSVSIVEELRWLEYGQRLTSHQRNRLTVPAAREVGTALYTQAVRGGAQAVGQPVGSIEPGRRADLVVLDGDHPMLAGCRDEQLLNRWLFGGHDNMVRDVYVAGQQAIINGHHGQETAAARAFSAAAQTLLSDSGL